MRQLLLLQHWYVHHLMMRRYWWLPSQGQQAISRHKLDYQYSTKWWWTVELCIVSFTQPKRPCSNSSSIHSSYQSSDFCPRGKGSPNIVLTLVTSNAFHLRRRSHVNIGAMHVPGTLTRWIGLINTAAGGENTVPQRTSINSTHQYLPCPPFDLSHTFSLPRLEPFRRYDDSRASAQLGLATLSHVSEAMQMSWKLGLRNFMATYFVSEEHDAVFSTLR